MLCYNILSRILFIVCLLCISKIGWPHSISDEKVSFSSLDSTDLNEIDSLCSRITSFGEFLHAFRRSSHPILLPSFASDAPHIPVFVEILLSPLISRFNFHYMRDQPTNRVDKPEWAFSFISSALNCQTHVSLLAFLDKSRQHGFLIFSSHLKKCRWIQASCDYTISLPSLFCNTLLATTIVLRTKKLVTYFKQLNAVHDESVHLSDYVLHFLRQLISFEKGISHLTIFGSSSLVPAQSAIACFASNADMFSLWITVDKKYVNKELEKLRALDRPWEVVDSCRSFSEFSRLFDAITERYRHFPSEWAETDVLQLRYFSEIQRPFLELYLEDVEIASRASFSTAKSFWKQSITALGIATKLFSFGQTSRKSSLANEYVLSGDVSSSISTKATYESAFVELVGQFQAMHELTLKLTQLGTADPLFLRLAASKNGVDTVNAGSKMYHTVSNAPLFFAAEIAVINGLALQVQIMIYI